MYVSAKGARDGTRRRIIREGALDKQHKIEAITARPEARGEVPPLRFRPRMCLYLRSVVMAADHVLGELGVLEVAQRGCGRHDEPFELTPVHRLGAHQVHDLRLVEDAAVEHGTCSRQSRLAY